MEPRERIASEQPGKREQPGMILDVPLADFLAWHAEYRPATATAYASDLLHLAAAFPASVSTCAQVSEGHLREYLEDLATASGARPAAIERKRAAIKAFFRTLYARGRLTHNPAERLKGRAVRPARPTLPTVEELERLLDPARATTPRQIRNQAMWHLLSEGLHLDELIRLQVEDLDLEPSLLWMRRPEETVVLTLSQASKLALERYLHEARASLMRSLHEQALFLSQQGKPLSRQWIWVCCKNACQQADLAPHAPSRLRRARSPQQRTSPSVRRQEQR